MKRSIALCVAAVLLAGCANLGLPRPMTLTCGMPKERLVERVTSLLVANGYDIKFSSVETGTVQAEINEGGSFGVDYVKRQWSIAMRRDSIIVNAKTLSKLSGTLYSETVETIDESNARQDAQWFRTIMEGIRAACSSSPIQSEQ